MAEVNTDITSARLLAESGLNRVVGMLESSFPDSSLIYPGTQADTFFHIPDTYAATNMRDRRINISYGSGDIDFTSHLETSLPSSITSVDSYVEWTTAGTLPQWKYIMMDTDADGTNDRIIGRIAYMVIDEGGKLDPNYVTDLSWTAPAKKEGTGTVEDRPGVSVEEINLRGAGVVAAEADNLDSETVNRWFSWSHLMTALCQGGTMTQNDMNNYVKALFPHSEPDLECYYADGDGDGDEDDVPFHRFNLARTDWDDVTVDSIIVETADLVGYDKTDSPNDGDDGILWLTRWKDAGTFPDPDGGGPLTGASSRRYQIAANLIDYCDSDDVPTTDYNDNGTPVDGSDDTITYMGLEETPYINEIAVYVYCKATVSDDASSNAIAYAFDAKVGAEVTRVHLTNMPLTCKFRILQGSIIYKYKDKDGNYIDASHDLAAAGNYASSIAEVDVTHDWSTDWKMAFNTMNTWNESGGDSGAKTAEIKDLKIKIDKARLTYNGVVVDFAMPDTNGAYAYTAVNPFVSCTGGAAAGQNTAGVWFSYQVEDPRQNLNDTDWPSPHPTASTDDTAYTGDPFTGDDGTPNANNVNADPSAGGGDTEVVTDPGPAGGCMSSGYIRNGPMESPWELGAIHRGAKWETLNFREFNRGGGIPATGGDDYSDATDGTSDDGNATVNANEQNGGDANILDQIKMTRDSFTYGKLNANSPYLAPLTALFENVEYGCLYSTPESGGTTIDNANAAKIANENTSGAHDGVLYANGALGGQAFRNRGELARAATVTGGTVVSCANDAEYEEIIGKTVNLTTVRPNFFTILVLAQSIKDVGGATLSKDLNGDGALEDNAADTYDADGDNNTSETIDETNIPTTYGTYDPMFDEILAEQKIMATLYRDAFTNTWKILSYEYLDQ